MDGLFLRQVQGLSYHLSISTRHGLLSFVMNIWCDTLFIYQSGVFAHTTFYSYNKVLFKKCTHIWCISMASRLQSKQNNVTTFTNYYSLRPYSNILRHNPAFIKIYEKNAKITQFKCHSIPPTYHNLSVHNSVHQHSPFSTQPSALSTQYWEII